MEKKRYIATMSVNIYAEDDKKAIEKARELRVELDDYIKYEKLPEGVLKPEVESLEEHPLACAVTYPVKGFFQDDVNY